MTDKQFCGCVREADNYQDRDTYVSDLALSSIWEDAAGDGLFEARLAAVGRIWDAAHKSVKQIAADAGMTQRKLAERFCIPVRTIEDWCAGKRTPPDYVRLMMQEILGQLDRSDG